jgi:GT2 family glycosyltransferase
MNNLTYSSQIKKLKPIVDLIVLSYNGLKTTESFLDRFYKHTDQEKIRLIWVDNGSTDGTKELLSSLVKEKDNFVFSSGEENLGVIGGRNHGKGVSDYLSGKFSTPEYLMILDNDQFVQPGWLEDHVGFLEKNNLDLIGVEAWYMNAGFLPIKKLERPGGSFHYVGCGGSLIKKEVVDTIGLYDEQFNPAYFEDPDFSFRVLDAGFKVGCNFGAKITHLPHQTLGKLNREEKNERFITSLRKFKQKWKGKKLRAIKSNLCK